MERLRFLFEAVKADVNKRVDSQRISKVDFVRNIGSGPIGPYMAKEEVLALVPSMHGQKVGRVGTIVAAIVLTVATTGYNPSGATASSPEVPAPAATQKAELVTISVTSDAVSTASLTQG